MKYLGRIVFSRPKDVPAFPYKKDVPAFPTTMIDDVSGLKLVKSEQFA